ncbi:capsular biosynthesis protein [Paenibacillus camerounensis]|uniref:capsular biosynthesis protein n=1 Tax=Paenibacillus camerounensis TaxID=1243663 RepID=UPI0005A84985|nr:capsular biosynthesis protein [Paenibacillus camerounensis]
MSNGKGTLVVDLDGTLCPIKASGEKYDDLIPYFNMVQKVKEWKEEGFTILIHTARNMRTHSGNLGLINAHTARKVMDWLDKWEIPYDEILFGKPWPGERGFYIDDRAIRPDEFLKYNEDELNAIVEKSREPLKANSEVEK